MSVVERARAEVAPHRGPATVVAAVAGVWALWASGPGWATPALVVTAVVGGLLGVIDARTHRLPNALTYPAVAALAALLTVAAAATGDWTALGRATVGALALSAFYLLLHLVNRAGMGLGDVKLAVLLGGVSAWFGWPVLIGALFLPFLAGGLAVVALLAARKVTRTSAIPFGPAMLAGTALAITWRAVFGA